MRTYVVSTITDEDLAYDCNFILEALDELKENNGWRLKPEDFTDEAMREYANFLNWFTDETVENSEEWALCELEDKHHNIVARCAIYKALG